LADELRAYGPRDIPELQARLAAADDFRGSVMQERVDSARFAGGMPHEAYDVQKTSLLLDLLNAGIKVQETRDGLLANDRVIVAIRSRKWRWNGKWIWYWYGTIQTVITLANGGRVSESPDYKPTRKTLLATAERLHASLGRTEPFPGLPKSLKESAVFVGDLESEYERRMNDGSLPATDRQVGYVNAISKRLGIPLPGAFTRAECGRFIEANETHFKDVGPKRNNPKQDMPGTAKGPFRHEPQLAERPQPESSRNAWAAPRVTAVPNAAKSATPPIILQTRKTPDYSKQKIVTVSPEQLAEHGLGTVDELVERLNARRHAQGRKPISSGDYPRNLANFKRLIREYGQCLKS
jgi:hypothetical protein